MKKAVQAVVGFQGFAYVDSKVILHYLVPNRRRQPVKKGVTREHSTVIARGQVTFCKEVLQHLGIKPGDKIELDLLPNGREVIKAARSTEPIANFVGLLAHKTQKVATIDEISSRGRCLERKSMRVTVDTNVLVCAVVCDAAAQAQNAAELLNKANVVAVSLVSLCEFAWVLLRLYGLSRKDVALAIRALMDARNVEVNRAAIEMGLRVLETGGDFADGVITFEGAWLGGKTFVSFDKKAVARLIQQDHSARLL